MPTEPNEAPPAYSEDIPPGHKGEASSSPGAGPSNPQQADIPTTSADQDSSGIDFINDPPSPPRNRPRRGISQGRDSHRQYAPRSTSSSEDSDNLETHIERFHRARGGYFVFDAAIHNVLEFRRAHQLSPEIPVVYVRERSPRSIRPRNYEAEVFRLPDDLRRSQTLFYLGRSRTVSLAYGLRIDPEIVWEWSRDFLLLENEYGDLWVNPSRLPHGVERALCYILGY